MKNILRMALSLGFLGALVWMERHRPLRRETEPKLRRTARNMTVAVLSAATIHFAETPVVRPLTYLADKKRWGVLNRRRLPPPVKTLAAVLLMDYTLYLWHILTHRSALLWRFHAVHHVDLDLDASTALRFHFGEMLLSVPYRAAQVFIIGVGPGAFTAWQTFLSLSILFHHSNMRLPERFERWLSRLLVTPRMHGIHHSSDPEQASSNWSSGLACWDRLHRTFRLDIAQESIRIGIDGIHSPGDVEILRILAMPFVENSHVKDFRQTAFPG